MVSESKGFFGESVQQYFIYSTNIGASFRSLSMKQGYKISACRGSKHLPPQCRGNLFGSRSARPLALLVVICLLVTLTTRVSARPSDASTSAVDRSNPVKVASVAHHKHQRRSAEEQSDGDYYDENYLRVKRCYEDEDVNELCQRCSKVTKSSLVFPMCCSNEDETMDWCRAYVYYGIQN
ncbi:uncharacterized protein LOC131685843 [Topomyia yanbarensis]|uniref:uncharacterized protein LOC131685843 n=1 Tax=Topomyia yanbarensis TaxID=2498891 RepID=UPI00273B60DD|nr:uncharacterized protein LOC131685843 [Topomyia yanbarensis]